MKAHHNKKVAESRGKKWRDNLVSGRVQAILHPTRLRLIRIEKKVRQNELATKLKITESTYGAIERAKRLVKQTTADAIAKALDTKRTQLFYPAKNGKLLALSARSR